MRAVFVMMLTAAALAAAVYIGLCLLLYFQQDAILFHPRPNDRALAREWASRRITLVSEGHELEGWWVEQPNAPTDLAVLYFGGNAEDALGTAATSSQYAARRMLFVNYRGYGGSAGRPSQPALYADALAIYDYAVGSAGVTPDRLVVMGRSLGASVAAMLAARRRVAGAVLITPFDSALAVAKTHYGIFPVRWLLKHPFPSDQFARSARAPALIVAAERDFVIPPAHAESLARQWAGPKQLQILQGVGHNDVHLHEEYFALVNGFLARL